MLQLPQSEDRPELNVNSIFYWNYAGLEMNRVTHSLGGPQTGPTMSSRALGLLHLAMHDAHFAVRGTGATWKPYLPAAQLPAVPAGADADEAIAGAAVTTLESLYGFGGPGISNEAKATLRAHLDRVIGFRPPPPSASFVFGAAVAAKILATLAVQPGEPGADQLNYKPKKGRFFFNDEPTHPVRLKPSDPNDPASTPLAQRSYHGPFYGTTARAIATQANHKLADPPRDTDAAPARRALYCEAVKQVVALGGAPSERSTKRTPDQTVAGHYWAYDAVNLIGSPPRLYNQILRVLAFSRLGAGVVTDAQTDQMVRLFALANVAMTDAGKFCWKEKYHFEFWRPLSGVREHDRASGSEAEPGLPPNPSKTTASPCGAPAPEPALGQQATGGEKLDLYADPFWLTLGAPDTNSHNANFKPPFPAYPSGHATFGAACFQIARRFFWDLDGTLPKKKDGGKRGLDAFSFTFVSDELNGVSRDLSQPYVRDAAITDQPGVVRTRVKRHFPSLWAAIVENAFSRIYLGVHWNFDAFLTPAGGPESPPGSPPDEPTPSNMLSGERSERWPNAGGTPTADLPIGGVPLGLDIADDIFDCGLTPSTAALAVMATPAMISPTAAQGLEGLAKSSNTNLR